jgi:MFS family permease
MPDAPQGPPAPANGRLQSIPAVRLLTRGPFAVYSLFNFLSLTGSWGQRVAAGLLVWEWTGSGFWLGVLALADLAPVVFIGPFAGVVADRWSRVAINRVFQSIIAILAAVLGVLVFADAITLALLIGLTAVNGTLTALTQPARLALVQELVPRADVGPAVAINAVKSNLARLVGPAVAATMIVHVHIAWVFMGNAAVTILFVLVLGRLTLIPSRRRRLEGGVLSQIADGFRYLMAEPSLRLVLITMLLGGVLVRSLGELLPAFAARSFADTATGLAMLTSSLAFGAVLAGLTIGQQPSEGSLMRRATFAWAGAAVFGFAFGLVTAPWAAMLCICGAGMWMARGLILTQTFVQLRAPEEMRGRALSVHGLIARSSPAIGALLIGVTLDMVGLPLSVAAATILFGVAFIAMRAAILHHAGRL